MRRRVILVTGGAGYIGSHAAKAVHQAGYEPHVCDNFLSGHRWAVRYGPLTRLDLLDQKKLTSLLQRLKPFAVMHFAASAEVEDSMRNPEKYFRNNMVATLNLLTAMAAAKCNRLIFSSSAAVYGTPVRRLARETDTLRPVNPYGESKWMCERLIAWSARSRPLKFVSFRYFNAAGADPDGELGELHRPEKHLIPSILRVAAGMDRTLRIYGTKYPTRDGTCVRDYCHVTDLARAHLQAVDYLADGGKNSAFNLGTNKGLTVREVIETAARVTGRPLRPKLSPPRPGDPPVLVADASAARAALGFRPRHSDIGTIVETAWRWIRRYEL